MSNTRPNCRRWMWIELLGFDNMEPDKRVQAFLDNAGFIPEVLSFLLCCPDFVHTYEGMEREVILPPDVCAYAGRPYNLERARQEWTNWQFKNLVEQLQQRGIQVYCSVMDLFHSSIDGQHYRSPWCNAHPELWAVRHTGEVSGSINPLKRMADGRYYEDFFVAKLRQLIGDYGFDGFHGAEGLPVELRYDMDAMLLFMKAALPDTPLMCLNCTGDTTENWDVLNHAPPVCEREHYSLGSLFLQDGRGFQHASAGPVVCLADGINAPQWRWMDRNWLVAYEKSPSRLLGPAILWSEAALAAEFADYVEHRALTRHKLCARLMGHGAPLLSVVRPVHLGQMAGPLLVPRPELLPADELQAALAHPGTVVLIGLNRADLPPPDFSLAEGPDPEQLCLRVYRPERGATLPDFAPPPPAPLSEEQPEPPNYLYDLYFRPTSDAFLQVCAQLLIALSKTPPVINGVAEARVLAYQTAPGWVRLLIGNEAHYYTQPQLDLGRQLREVRIASHFPGKPIQPQGTTLIARVPPRGMVVLDVNVA